MNNGTKLQLTVLKNHGGSFSSVQPKQLVREVDKDVLIIYPQGKSNNLGMAILEFAALTDGIKILQKRATFWKGTQLSY